MWGSVSISAWALTLSVQQDKAMRRPQIVGRTTGVPTLFYAREFDIVKEVCRKGELVATILKTNS